MKFSATDVVVCVRENGNSISGSQHGRKSLRRNLRRTQTTFSRERERSGKKVCPFSHSSFRARCLPFISSESAPSSPTHVTSTFFPCSSHSIFYLLCAFSLLSRSAFIMRQNFPQPPQNNIESQRKS